MNPGFFFDGLGNDDEILYQSQADHPQSRAEDNPIDLFKKKNAPPRVSIDEIIARHKKPDEGILHLDKALEDWKSEDDEASNLEEDSDGNSSSSEVDGEDDGVLEPVDESGEEAEEIDAGSDDEEGSSDDQESDADEEKESDADEENDKEPTEKDIARDAENQAAVSAYFDQTVVAFDPPTKEELDKDSHDQPFSSLPGGSSLSRPILLGLSSMAVTTPTPIQRQTIPLALLGKDLVCSSVTGSGKTLGYLVPIFERLMWRDKKGGGKTRVMILTPTRELAVQVYQVGKSLARYTDLTFSLCVGGMNLRTQEAELRERPEIVVGTPGRVIDHVRNTRGFSLDTLEILVIDEADRILEEGFRDELEEIINNCPRSRQTMLFSATVSESVADLARLSLEKPIRIKIDPPKSTAAGLTQEFLRVRDDQLLKKGAGGADLQREAILVTLCKASSFSKGRTIIFFRSKLGAHRMKVIFSLFGLKAAELHGNLTQEQRMSSLQDFKDGKISYLLATDLASRGLDIKGVERVINYETPNQYEVYLHRIGRTARAGKKGSALTLVGESDRKLVKEARRNCQGTIKQRKIDPKIVQDVSKELARLQSSITTILEDEQEEKILKKTEMELKKGQNLIDHDDEIKSRPARTWFQSESDKKKSKDVGTSAHTANFTKTKDNKGAKRDKFDGLSRAQKRRKMANEEDAQERPVINSSIRAAKKAQRPAKIGMEQESYKSQNSKKKSKSKPKKGKSSFSTDLGEKKSFKASSKPSPRINKKMSGSGGKPQKGGKAGKPGKR